MSRDYKIGDENNKKPQAESLRQVGDQGSTTIVIPEGKTENYMDYSRNRNMFFLYQWKKVKVYEQNQENKK